MILVIRFNLEEQYLKVNGENFVILCSLPYFLRAWKLVQGKEIAILFKFFF